MTKYAQLLKAKEEAERREREDWQTASLEEKERIRKAVCVSTLAIAEYEKKLFKKRNNFWSGFRRSKTAMILDVLLLPIGIIKGISLAGIPAVYDELKNMPKRFMLNWRVAGWFREKECQTMIDGLAVEGKEAFEEGELIEENPYDEGTDGYESWKRGYLKAEKELDAKQKK